MKQLVLLCYCFLPVFVFSNTTDLGDLIKLNRRAKYPVGINVHAFGPSGITGLSLDWFLKPKFNLEFGAGIHNLKTVQPAYFAGGKYHFLGNSIVNTTFYLGVFDKVIVDSSIVDNTIYVPFGVQKIKKNKLTWNIEVAYTFNIEASKSQIWGAFKLGYRFNRFDHKKKKKSWLD